MLYFLLARFLIIMYRTFDNSLRWLVHWANRWSGWMKICFIKLFCSAATIHKKCWIRFKNKWTQQWNKCLRGILIGINLTLIFSNLATYTIEIYNQTRYLLNLLNGIYFTLITTKMLYVVEKRIYENTYILKQDELGYLRFGYKGTL